MSCLETVIIQCWPRIGNHSKTIYDKLEELEKDMEIKNDTARVKQLLNLTTSRNSYIESKNYIYTWKSRLV